MRPIKLHGGKIRGYYLQPHHQAAILAFQDKHSLASVSAAARAILDQVAMAYGVPIPKDKAAG